MFKLDFGNSSLGKTLNDSQQKNMTALRMYADTKAPELESYMKTNRKWTDRTGMAKATLRATVSKVDDTTIRITLSYGVDYGIWLELANEKNYAIIEPTIRLNSSKIVEDLQYIFPKMFVGG